MKYKPLLLTALAIIFISSAAFAQSEEKITLSTYYPAPYGVYEELFVTGALQSGPGPALGIDSTLTAAADSENLTAVHIAPTFDNAGFSTVTHTGLIVEDGNVGIGTTTPLTILHLTQSKINDALTLEGANTGGVRTILNIVWLNRDTNNGDVEYTAAKISSHNAGSSDDGDLRFFTTSDLTNTEHMRIDYQGNIDMRSTTGALIVPRLTTAQIAAISPLVNGMIVYDTDTTEFKFYENGGWTTKP